MQEYLKKCSEAYYAGNPLISDLSFDLLVDVFGFEAVGAKPAGKAVKHLYRMFSLNKHYKGEGEEPLAQFKKVKTPKLDGAAIEALYVGGKLTRVCTRGDGIEGIDITAKFLTSKVLPLEIAIKEVVQVIGEIVAPKTIENSRNYAAGALNLKDSGEFNTRDISFVAYGVQPYLTDDFVNDMVKLELQGFKTVITTNLTDTFPTDGEVVRVLDNKEFEKLGYTAKFPRGAYAIKTRGQAIETTLLSVEWGVGKSGKVTPVAILEPVFIGDALVSRATLNNGTFIEDLGLYIGCTVGVVRAGEIIPQIVYKAE
jgi:NAD-dependent DNA ligase